MRKWRATNAQEANTKNATLEISEYTKNGFLT